MRIRELADEAHVSTTTILRFCKKLKCEGYSDLNIAYSGEKLNSCTERFSVVK